MKLKTSVGLCLAVLGLAGCLASNPTVGDSNAKTAATGSAGGDTAHNANKQIERCDKTMGTVAVAEDQSAPWYAHLRSYKLQSTVPVLRMLIQQSNCFVVVERGAAMRNMEQERLLRDSGEMRAGSNMHKGQVAAADYTMTPTIVFSEKNTGGAGAALGGLLGPIGAVVAGGVRFSEANTMLTLIDNRSSVQLAAAEGSSRNTDFNLFGGLFGGGGFGGAGGYSNSPEGKLIIAAFVDSYNQMVKAVRNYRAQSVEGGLGTGGQLGVQGGDTPASQEVGKKKAPVKPKK